MSSIAIGERLPDIALQATGGQVISLPDLTGQNIVLYFYPKDNTPGCTQEGQDFQANFETFTQLNTRILGVSRDSVKKHENFKAKYDFPFELLSDPDEVLCQAFDVIKPKNMYGKQVIGIERSTFLFDREGILCQEWRKVRVKGHVDAVLDAVRDLNP